MDRGRMMSANVERAEAVAEFLRVRKNVTTDFVCKNLRCGRGQARRAIRTARFMLADEGKRLSYATRANDYTVSLEGSGVDRTRSYITRSQTIITQRRNAARVMGPSVDHGSSSKSERAIASWALADQMAAEADQIRLNTLKELLQ